MDTRTRIAMIGLATMLGLAPAPAMASLFTAAQAYNAHRYGEALVEFERLAKRGDSEAQLYAGLMHDNGLGTARDTARAFYWYMQAAKQDQPRAQFNVADMLYHGSGTRQDRHAAMIWYEKSANNGFPEAQYRWGLELRSGRYVPKDLEGAYMWLAIAAGHHVGGAEKAAQARDTLGAHLSAEQRKHAEHKLRVWRLLHDQRRTGISL